MAFAKLKAAAVAGAFLYFAAGAHGGGPVHAILADAAPVPSGGSYTPQTWASAWLSVIGEPDTSCNQAAVVAWENTEAGSAWGTGGADDPELSHNSLNTTYSGPGGSWLGNGRITRTINSDGVRWYDSWATGLQANATVIEMPAYAGVLSALQSGDNAQQVADAVAASPWGTSSFSATC